MIPAFGARIALTEASVTNTRGTKCKGPLRGFLQASAWGWLQLLLQRRAEFPIIGVAEHVLSQVIEIGRTMVGLMCPKPDIKPWELQRLVPSSVGQVARTTAARHSCKCLGCTHWDVGCDCCYRCCGCCCCRCCSCCCCCCCCCCDQLPRSAASTGSQ